jgi:hypothetical protein
LDLLNENIDIESAHKLSMWAKDAVDFLKQSKVVCKTLEPNFCHAKLYLSKNEKIILCYQKNRLVIILL